MAAEHGTRNGYLRIPCRCEDCKAANAKYMRDIRCLHRKRRTMPPGVTHGSRYTRTYYGCTCDLCRAAHRDYMREFRARRAK